MGLIVTSGKSSLWSSLESRVFDPEIQVRSSPFAFALVLSAMVRKRFQAIAPDVRRKLRIFFTRPISCILMVVGVILFSISAIPGLKRNHLKKICDVQSSIRKEEQRMKKKGIVLHAALITAFWIFSAMAAENYPTRPVEIISPNAPGGGMDFTLNLFKRQGREDPGSTDHHQLQTRCGGCHRTVYAKAAKPDGYSLMAASISTLVLPPLSKRGAAYSLDDFTPICTLTTIPLVFCVREDSPYKTMQEFIQAAKTKKMKYATHGAFTTAPYLHGGFGEDGWLSGNPHSSYWGSGRHDRRAWRACRHGRFRYDGVRWARQAKNSRHRSRETVRGFSGGPYVEGDRLSNFGGDHL